MELWGWGERTGISPRPFPGSAQLQDGIRAGSTESATTPHPKPVNPSRALKAQYTKKGEAPGEILFLPVPPTLQEGSFPAVELHAISG